MNLPDNVSGPCSLSEIVNSQRPAIVSVCEGTCFRTRRQARGVAISAILQEPARSPHPLPAFVMVCAANVRARPVGVICTVADRMFRYEEEPEEIERRRQQMREDD